jgi:hypothetical protein
MLFFCDPMSATLLAYVLAEADRSWDGMEEANVGASIERETARREA